MSNFFEQMRDTIYPPAIRIPFDSDRSPQVQIEAAIASTAPSRCSRHPHELRPVDRQATVQHTLHRYDDGYTESGCRIDFTATYERCARCPHSNVDHDIEVRGCAVDRLCIGKRDYEIRDENGRPLPTQSGSAALTPDRSARELFNSYIARRSELRCELSDQPLHLREARLQPPRESWAITPQFAPCLQCSLESLGITPDEAGASFENFVIDPPELAQHIERCRAFATAPKGVLLLLGNCGTGKTHLAVAILRELARRRQNGLHFVKHRHFLDGHWRSLRPVPFGTERPTSPLTNCQESSILVYDELTAAADSRAYEDVLLDLLERRIGNFRPTVITANITPGELEATVGTKLFDRLRRAAFAVLEFGFESKRSSLNADYLSHNGAEGRA